MKTTRLAWLATTLSVFVPFTSGCDHDVRIKELPEIPLEGVSAALGQPGSLTICVEKDGKGLAGIDITIPGHGTQRTDSKTGCVYFPTLKAGEYKAVGRVDGEEYRQKIEIRAGYEKVFDIDATSN